MQRPMPLKYNGSLSASRRGSPRPYAGRRGHSADGQRQDRRRRPGRRLHAHGAELLGEVARYESMFLLCYLRGPAGIIVALAEQIG